LTHLGAPNHISIGTAIFVGLTHVPYWETNRHTGRKTMLHVDICCNRPHLCNTRNAV